MPAGSTMQACMSLRDSRCSGSADRLMREFGKGGFSLRSAPRRLRFVYAGFLVLTAIGFATQFGFEIGRIGLTPAAIATFYRGSESGDVMIFPKTAAQLLEVTHAHA